ncbi:MAG: hypothetical protein U0R64_06090 [Candidatus Nanopelagicales bacterium]
MFSTAAMLNWWNTMTFSGRSFSATICARRPVEFGSVLRPS